MNIKIILSAAVLSAAVSTFPGVTRGAQGTFWEKDAILAEFFPGADAVEPVRVDLSGEAASRLKDRLGYVPKAPLGLWVGKKDGAVLGWAVIDDEKGMHEPITFAVLVGPDGRVQRQEVMVYREPEGDGVTQARFRRQFVGKTSKDALRAGVDIRIVSGATISSTSMAMGVKRAAAIVELTQITRDAEKPLARLPGSGT